LHLRNEEEQYYFNREQNLWLHSMQSILLINSFSTSLVQAATNIKTNEGSKASKNNACSLWLPWRRSQQASLKHH